jgi:hypothetical protein
MHPAATPTERERRDDLAQEVASRPAQGAIRGNHRARHWLLLDGAVPLLAAACGGSDNDESATAVEVRPFEQVQDSKLVFEADSTDPSRAVFRVATTEPMVCAIVWGEDGSFGRFNNSLSMNGTGITDHNVVLPDVEAGVTYSHVVQGTTADGTLYRSDIGTFTIDRATTATTGPGSAKQGENLAPGATIGAVSSEFSDAFAVEHAIDGDTDTEWATAGDGDDGYVTLDLGSPQGIAAVEFVTRSMGDGSAVTSTYTVTIDGANPLGPHPAGTIADPQPANLDTRGQIVRLDVESSTGGNIGAVEIRILAPTGS